MLLPVSMSRYQKPTSDNCLDVRTVLPQMQSGIAMSEFKQETGRFSEQSILENRQ